MKNCHLLRPSAVLSGALAAIGIAPSANAVHLSAQGAGQVLIFPYYTVRNSNSVGYNTVLSLVNTTAQTKTLKVRFLEGRRGAQVMDFNLFLSPYDTWTGALAATTLGTRLLTSDNSCVTPIDLFSVVGKSDFRNAAYASDSGPADLDRTREGHFEVIEMGVITNTTITGYIKQTGDGIPKNCGAIADLDPSSTSPSPKFSSSDFLPPAGGLTGRAVVISPESGASYGYDATALEAWSTSVQYTGTGSEGPALSAAVPATSLVVTSQGIVTAQWTTGRDAVSATLMRAAILSEWAWDSATTSQTDWIITFPTKREYVNVGTGAAIPPFYQNFNMANTSMGGACDPYFANTYDRESGTVTPPGTTIIGVTPPPSAQPGSVLCWNANVISFVNGKSLLGARNTNNLVDALNRFNIGAATTVGPATSTSGKQGPNGWMRIAFSDPAQGITPISATRNGTPLAVGRHIGLPIIALSFTNFINTGVTSQYGIAHQAKYETSVTP
jgi:hypothetical protein